MRSLIIFVLLCGLVIVPTPVQSESKPAAPHYDPYQLYEQQFDVQMEQVNIDMEAYSNTECTDKTFPAIAHLYVDEYNKFLDLWKSRPKGEDNLTKYKQAEIFLGLTELSESIDKAKNKCLRDAFPATTPATPATPGNGTT